MSREEIHNCARWFPPVLLTDEEYFNIGKGGACMHNPYLEIALFQQKKSFFWLDIFSSTAQLHMYYLQKLIDEYTNSFFLSGGGERGLTWRKIFIQCFEN